MVVENCPQKRLKSIPQGAVRHGLVSVHLQSGLRVYFSWRDP
jgi:hypothetical protein